MGYSGFSKLQTDDIVEDGIDVPRASGRRNRTRPFTPFELGLITTLILFAAALATYTIIYIVQHRGAIRPAAVAALSCVALLLLAVAYSVYKRIRRPNWFRDVESGASIQKWTISAPIPMSQTNMSEVTIESKATYTSLSSKTRLQKQPPKPADKKPNRLKFWTSKKSDEAEHLISSTSSERSSAELSEDYRPPSLWRSVFELPGEDPDASRPATPELPTGNVQIIVTKPEPTARQSLHRGRAQSSSSADISALRRSLLAVDPLRSNPFHQLQRDPSVRQTRSSHALGDKDRPLVDNQVLSAPIQPRRPRSAEPGPDRARLGYDLAAIQLQIDRAAAEMDLKYGRVGTSAVNFKQPLPSPPPPQTTSQSRSRPRSRSPLQKEQQGSRPLRRAKSPVVVDVSDLRTAYQVGK